MPIVFTNERQPTGPIGASAYICQYPSIALKKCGQYETDLQAFYEKYPIADYYTQHDSTGQRGKAGEYKRYQPKGDQPGILNLYVKVYPGTKAYPNDNTFTRVKNFNAVFKDLATAQGISELHLEIPSKVPAERQEYMACLEDYISSCQLHGNVVTVYVYGPEVPKPEQSVGKAKPKIQITQKSRPAPAAAAPVAGAYKLVFKEADLNEVLLYEVDFVRVDTTPESSGIMTKFPKGWERITDDTILAQEAVKVDKQLALGQSNIFPPEDDIFNAFAYLKAPPKVVILGQDPYHGPGQAHGLSFSVQEKEKIPPSLRNIFNALENDENVEFTRPTHGCLKRWAEQGIILLNSALTVEQSRPKSHLDIWTPFTDRLIQLLSIKYPDLIFVLWGGDAKKKKSLITGNTVLEFNHPSPAMPNNTFGTQCKHFSQINELLAKKGKSPIDWNL